MIARVRQSTGSIPALNRVSEAGVEEHGCAVAFRQTPRAGASKWDEKEENGDGEIGRSRRDKHPPVHAALYLPNLVIHV